MADWSFSIGNADESLRSIDVIVVATEEWALDLALPVDAKIAFGEDHDTVK